MPDEPTRTYHSHTEAIVYIRVRAWCCLSYCFIQMYNDMCSSLYVQKSFAALKILISLPFIFLSSVQFSSVAQSCPTICDPMNRSMPGLPVHHQLPEFTQTDIHRVHDAIQPSHPLPSPSPPPPIPPNIRVFSNESTLHLRWPKYWSFSFSIFPSEELPGLISFRMDWLDLLAVQGILKSLLQHHS